MSDQSDRRSGARLRVVPPTKAARQALIAEIVASYEVSSQPQLAGLLAARSTAVNQATLSRDLDELGATKRRLPSGTVAYVLPETTGRLEGRAAAGRLARVCQDLLTSAEVAANQVVLRTPPAGANLLASAVDRSAAHEVIGSIAGDDTVLVICRDARAARRFADQLLKFADA